jgi:hypothetical protein
MPTASTSFSTSFRLRQIVDPDIPHFNLEYDSEKESGSIDETDYDFKPDDDEPEKDFSPASELSQLEIFYSYTDGRRSSIKEIKFYDARDVRSGNQWKVVLPFDKNQCHRVAAAMAILCEEVTDAEGALLASELGAKLIELLLTDVDREKALNSMGVLYTTYRTEDKTNYNEYLRFARRKLRHWYDEKAQVNRNGHPKSVKITFQSGQLKRALEADQDTATSPPAKRHPQSLHTVNPKPDVAETIHVESSPQIPHPKTPSPQQSSTAPRRRSSSLTPTYSTVRHPSIPAIPTLENQSPPHAPMKALGKTPLGIV